LAYTLPSSRDKERRFVISYRSEEALGQELARTTFWMGVAAAGVLALGAVVAVAGFIVAIG
jgi:E3 Ubiquitin ligase